jgi:AraC family transcriptional regulator
MRGPSAVLHPAGRPHADRVHGPGLETLTIEFDPAWLRFHGVCTRLDRSLAWSGGLVGLAARRLSSQLVRPASCGETIGRATAEFLNSAFNTEPLRPPQWVERASECIAAGSATSTLELARQLDLHPAYLTRSYRIATGEGLAESWRRRRVEQASAMLRRTELPLAEIAAAAGFCDQSHMNRCFSAVLGRTPLRVRAERRMFEERACPSAH